MTTITITLSDFVCVDGAQMTQIDTTIDGGIKHTDWTILSLSDTEGKILDLLNLMANIGQP